MNGSVDGPARAPKINGEFMRAVARSDTAELKRLIALAKEQDQLTDDLLRTALQNAAKKGLSGPTQLLLEQGAQTGPSKDTGAPAIYRAAVQNNTKGHTEVIRLLLDKQYKHTPVDVEWRDTENRTIFMNLAIRGHADSLKLLLDHGVDIHTTDREGRTILHILASDKSCKWRGTSVVSMLLALPVDIDARDWMNQRTPLHMAAVTGKADLIERFMSRSVKPNINAVAARGKTALHLACDTESPSVEVVQSLLRHGADPTLASDGGWLCFHNAAQRNAVDIMHVLISDRQEFLNARTSNGWTALHIASQVGNEDAVKCLLEYANLTINAKDNFYMTPLLRAAQGGHDTIVHLLAPFNNVQQLGHLALHACNNFDATIVDFRTAGGHSNLVQKRTVYEVLYAKTQDGEHAISTNIQGSRQDSKPPKGSSQPSSRINFRWIHLPANNLAWAEALITKAFIEGGCRDVDGFKAIERCFSQQHRGELYHSNYMRTLCYRSARGNQPVELNQWSGSDTEHKPMSPFEGIPEHIGPLARRDTSDGGLSLSGRPENFPRSVRALAVSSSLDSPPAQTPNNEPTVTLAPPAAAVATPSPSPTPPANKRRRFKKGKSDGMKPLSRATSVPMSEASLTSLSKLPIALHGSNICLFMPYLHFETDESRLKMQEAVENATTAKSIGKLRKSRHPQTRDERLLYAHLRSSTGLHLRRTLDQFYLHGIDTRDRDGDQVVARYCRKKGREEKLFMVDQLWLWILGPGLIVTCFPQRWQQPKNDPLNVLDGLIEDINSKTRSPIANVYDLALLITARCTGAFDRHKPGDDDFQFLEMFENSIGNVNNEETDLYKGFYAASEKVHDWLRTASDFGRAERMISPIHHRYPEVVDRFLDIGQETALLQEVKDIHSELNMLSLVLGHQKSVLPALRDAIAEDIPGGHTSRKRSVQRRTEDQERLVDSYLHELDRMARLARDIEKSLLSLLDLKQKQSNAFEARFARDQAASTVQQGQVIIIFTVVTIIFLPISFMAQFFTINITEFPRNGQGNLPLGYVTRYMLGIGLGISVAMVLVAFSLNKMGDLVRQARVWLEQRHQRAQQPPPLIKFPTINSTHTDVHRFPRSSQDTRRISFHDDVVPRTVRLMSETSNAISQRKGYSRDLERG